ncbi:sugar ABC transporter permease [Pseudothermotoga thermarum]|uniref:Binding-protein-dependent transport systems inner membrane component n=1 Tax=Pseudothermotoga thermarum DSM 5069 TaxID=688269 RepID=F7YUQ5_9THEM|nr:sugar ABC transporter permease [Pseudothermotoga thermarum]AEH50240.1 binding-protein-dependent transport systems inner membrane component [Pseudothermotoga thermarum DSM 5069]
MVQKRITFLTHAILIFLIAIILFPVVWVVSTSIRRDEAAFSTKLFTSRVTLQNYVDLLMPEKNIPVLIQELQNIVSKVKPYDKISQQRARELVEKYIQKLELYLDETDKRFELARQSYSNITTKMQQNAEKIKENIVKDLEELKAVVQNNLPKLPIDDLYAVALYEKLQNEKFGSLVFAALKKDLEAYVGRQINDADTFKDALAKLNEVYEKIIGSHLEKLRYHERRISELNFAATQIRNKIVSVQNEVITANLFINEVVLPQLTSLSQSFDSLLRLKTMVDSTKILSPFSIDDSKMLLETQQLLSQVSFLLDLVQTYSDYKQLEIALASLEKSLTELLKRDESIVRKSQYLQVVNIFEDLKPRLERVLSQLEEVFLQTGEKIVILKSINDQLVDLQREIENEMANKNSVEILLKNLDDSMKHCRTVAELKIFVNQLEDRINTIKNIRSLSSADLTRYSAVLTFLRNFANSYEAKDQISLQLSKVVKNLRWIEEYRDFIRRFENVSKNLNEVLSNSRTLIDDFKKTYDGLLAISFAGVFVRSDVLNRFFDLVKTDFVSKVKADMAVVTRRSGNLMDLDPTNSLKADYKNIDKQLYRIDNIWKQKPKHYFLNWVLNSVIVATVVGLITTAVCAVAAYPFSRMRFFGRRYGLLAFLLIQMFPAVIFMIAIYNLLNFLGKYVPFLGIDTLGGLIFSYLTGIAYNMYLMKGFYDTIPPSLEEAAIVDGATRFQSFYKIILPLSRPILVVVFLLVFIGTFNEFVVARIVLQNVRNYTYALGLQTFAVGPYETEWGLFTAAALLGMTPMVILFLSMQRFLVSGLTRGAVKE